jgi:hypothetical protein
MQSNALSRCDTPPIVGVQPNTSGSKKPVQPKNTGFRTGLWRVNVGKTRPILKLVATFVSAFSLDNGNKSLSLRTFSTFEDIIGFFAKPSLREVQILDGVDVPEECEIGIDFAQNRAIDRF